MRIAIPLLALLVCAPAGAAKTARTARKPAARKPAAAARKVVPALVGAWSGSQVAQGEKLQMTVRLGKDGRYSAAIQAQQRRSTDTGAWWGDKSRVHRRSAAGRGQPVVSYTYRLQGRSLVLTSKDGTKLRLTRQ